MRAVSHAKRSPVLFLCLGADFEFIVDRREKKALVKTKGKVKGSTSQSYGSPPPMASAAHTSELGVDYMSEADQNEHAEEPGDDEHEDAVNSAQTTVRKQPDLLRIALTHGNILVVTGCDLNVRMLGPYMRDALLTAILTLIVFDHSHWVFHT